MSPHCHTIIQALRDRGYRLTPQREMVIETIAHAGRHMTAEEVFAELQGRTRALNIATVYRTLDLLFAEGFVSRFAQAGGRLAYATVRHGPHVHLVCRKCGYTIEANDHLLSALGEALREHYRFAADLQHLSVQGLCQGCQAEGALPPGGDDAAGTSDSLEA